MASPISKMEFNIFGLIESSLQSWDLSKPEISIWHLFRSLGRGELEKLASAMFDIIMENCLAMCRLVKEQRIDSYSLTPKVEL